MTDNRLPKEIINYKPLCVIVRYNSQRVVFVEAEQAVS
jgi:hypothetical protein